MKTILFYPIYSIDDENTKEYIKERFVYDDGDGRKYMKSPLVNSLFRPNLKYIFQGINPPANGWLYSKQKMEEFFINGELIIPDNPDARIYRRIYLETYKGQVIQNIWTDIPIVNPMAKEQVDFSTQKPEKLLERIITVSTNPSDIVLDYHLGSGTTAAVAHKMGRRYVGIEQMDYIETVAVARLKKIIGKKTEILQKTPQQASLQFVAEPTTTYQTTDYDQGGISKAVNWQGGGSFVYCELGKANQEFADQILASENKEELASIWQQMQETGFLSWKIDPRQIDENAEGFDSLSVKDTQRFLLEALDKNLLYIPYSEIENQEFGISEEEKRLNAQFYGKA